MMVGKQIMDSKEVHVLRLGRPVQANHDGDKWTLTSCSILSCYF